MKHFATLFLFAVLAFTTLNSTAQITILSSDFTEIGDQIIRHTDTIPTYGPGGDGPNQVWDFSGAINDTISTTSVVSVASTPFSSTFSGSDYAMGGGGDSYLFFTHDNSALTTTGAAGDLVATGEIIEAPFTDPLTLHQFPRTYDSEFDDTYAFEAEADGSAFSVERVRLTHNGHVYDTTDAYGTLITPTGTYEVLRVKTTDYTTDVIEVQVLPFPPIFIPFTTVTDTTVTYSWHAKEQMLAIAEFAFDSIGNPARFTYSSVPPVSTVGVDELQEDNFQLFPQPANDKLCIQFINNISAHYAQIFGVNGNLIKETQLTQSCLDTKDLSRGIYLLRIRNKNGVPLNVRKFIIE